MIEFFDVVACPQGYSAVDGDASSFGGLTGGYQASMDECKSDCDARTDCYSLLYSSQNTQCKLMKEKSPTSLPSSLVYQFCKRQILRKLRNKLKTNKIVSIYGLSTNFIYIGSIYSNKKLILVFLYSI